MKTEQTVSKGCEFPASIDVGSEAKLSHGEYVVQKGLKHWRGKGSGVREGKTSKTGYLLGLTFQDWMNCKENKL